MLLTTMMMTMMTINLTLIDKHSKVPNISSVFDPEDTLAEKTQNEFCSLVPFLKWLASTQRVRSAFSKMVGTNPEGTFSFFQKWLASTQRVRSAVSKMVGHRLREYACPLHSASSEMVGHRLPFNHKWNCGSAHCLRPHHCGFR